MTVNAGTRIAAKRARRKGAVTRLLADADELDAIAARATEAARQKRLTAHQLQRYELDINDLREHHP